MLIGRREWLSLPELGIDMLTAKVDTGAYTSSLNADRVEDLRARWKTDGEFQNNKSPRSE